MTHEELEGIHAAVSQVDGGCSSCGERRAGDVRDKTCN